MTSKGNVAILGCGPAGLLAAEAAVQNGYEPVIFSKKIKSRMGGAQFLHEHIPGLTAPKPHALLSYSVRGDAATYAEKVYNRKEYAPAVSFSDVHDGQQMPAWNLTTMYETLWIRYSDAIVDVTEIDPMWMRGFVGAQGNGSGDIPLVFSTIPQPAICTMPAFHTFGSQRVYIAETNVEPIPDNTVLYDGTRERSWYRESRIFGWKGTEWSEAFLGPKKRPPVPGLRDITKPIWTDCDCWRDNIIRLGRYGEWRKGVLTHSAYRNAMRVLATIEEADAHASVDGGK